MSNARTSDLWWKNAVVYCLDPETFLDTDGDGWGDLAGVTERIDYLAGFPPEQPAHVYLIIGDLA